MISIPLISLQELLGHAVDTDGGEGEADEEAEAVADPADELCDNVWAAVTGTLECGDARAAEILEKSIALRGPDNKYFDLLNCEEIQDAFKEDDYKEVAKYLETVESRDKASRLRCRGVSITPLPFDEVQEIQPRVCTNLGLNVSALGFKTLGFR